MRKFVSVSIVLVAVAGAVYLAVNAQTRRAKYQQLAAEVGQLRAERVTLANELREAKRAVVESQQIVARLEKRFEAQEQNARPTLGESGPVDFKAPAVTLDANGKKSFLFAELPGAKGQVIAREARFRELLGNTKFSFRTSEGIRYYDLNDLHPEVIRALGYDSAVLNRRAADELRLAQLRGLQAQAQQELRSKAVLEQLEREKAEAEKIKAEAAMRDAEARERLALAAERAAANPPKPERIVQKVIVAVPYKPEQPKPELE